MDEIIEKKNKTKSVVFIIIFLIICFYAFFRISSENYSLIKSELNFAKVSSQPFINSISVNGRLEAESQRKIISTVPGIVKEINVELSQKVEKGQVLVALKSNDLEKRVQEYTLEFLQSKSNLDKLIYENSLEQLDIDSQILQTNASLKRTKAEINSLSALKEKGVISDFSYQKIVGDYNEMLLILENLKNKKSSHRKHSLKYIDNLKSINTQKEQIVNLVKSEVESLKIKSSVEGRVLNINKSINVGDLIMEGTNIMTIGNTEKLNAILQVPAFQAENLTIESNVEILIGAMQFSAKIKSISPQVTNQFIEVVVLIEDSLPENTRPDQSITAEISLLTGRKEMHVNRPQYIKDPKTQNFLYVLEENENKLIKKEIKILSIKGSQVVFKSSSIKPLDKVLVSNVSDTQPNEYKLEEENE